MIIFDRRRTPLVALVPEILRPVRLSSVRGGLFSKGRNKIFHHDMERPLGWITASEQAGPVQAPTETLSWGFSVAYFKRMLPSLCNEKGFCVLWKRGPHGRDRSRIHNC